jgi:hypothetical protein
MSVRFSGLLLKRHAFLKTWKRHFYLIHDNFFIEQQRVSHDEVSRFPITGSTKVERITLVKSKKHFTFHIILRTNCRPLVYAADNEDLLQQWVTTLNEVKLSHEQREKPNISLGLGDFDIVAVLGRGTYGMVSLVKHRESGQLFAMKAMSKSLLVEDGNIQQILDERDVLVRNHHPFLVSAHMTFQTDTKIFLLMDYIPGGELYQRLREERRFVEERVRLASAELVLGIGHLHRMGFIYRDLKPENVLFDERGHVKLCDFGYA